MRKVPKFVWSLLACLLCIVVTAAIFMFTGDSGTSSDKYQEVISVIRENFYKEPDTSSLEDASAAAMVASLGDASSYYLTAEEYEEYKLTTTNQCIGIGITTEYNDKYGYLTVTSVSVGSPADLAHIRVGNMVAAINNTDVSEYSPDQLDDYMESFSKNEDEDDQYFTVHLLNAQGGHAEAKVKCEQIYVSPVTYEVIDGTYIGYIKVLNFDDSVASALKTAVSELQKQGAKSLIFDIRDNQTGKTAELSEALDYLLPKCDMFLLRDRNGKQTTYSSGNSCVSLPMVVIINENTAGAAEVFAYCLQQDGSATVVGRRTAGNSNSQVIVELTDGSAVCISKYQYLTPDQKSLEELGGVTPNVSSSQIDDSDMDVQLEAAKDAAE